MNWTELLTSGWFWSVALVVAGAALTWFGRRATARIDSGRAQLAASGPPRHDTERVHATHAVGSHVEPATTSAHEHPRSAGHRHRHGCC